MTDLHRRAMLRGAALSAVAISAPALAAQPGGSAAKSASGATKFASDRAVLAALPDPAAGDLVFLTENGREGAFKCCTGPHPADALQGLYVASGTAGFHYSRLWDGVRGRPEWFGAITGDAESDCADAIEACYAACPVSELSQADYYIRRTLRFNRDARTIIGVSTYAAESGEGTRIILHRSAPDIHAADIILVGHMDPPGLGSRGLVAKVHISNLTLLRDGPCTPHRSGNLKQYPAGLRASYLVHCTFSGIASLESSVGFYIGGAVYTKFDDCLAQRLRPGTIASRDYAVGYYLDGHISFGYAGGNASLYLNRCLAADQHPAHVDPVGLKGVGAFVDTFLDHFETARIDTGIAFLADGARSQFQTVDLHIRNAVLDGCGKFGIQIDLDQTSNASIEILDPYIYPASAGGDRGILVYGGAGLVTITGGQVHGDFAGGSVWLSRTRGVRLQGTKIHQALKPVVVLEASGLLLEPQINNFAKTSNSFAIDCTSLSRSILRPIVIGAGAPAFRGGINLDGTTAYCEIDGSAVDPGSFMTVDAAYKLRFNGRDARTGAGAAAFGAAENKLVGVAN